MQYALLAAKEALDDARWKVSPYPISSLCHIPLVTNQLSAWVAEDGPPLSLSVLMISPWVISPESTAQVRIRAAKNGRGSGQRHELDPGGGGGRADHLRGEAPEAVTVLRP